MKRFVELANEFLQRFRRSGEPGLERLPEDLAADATVRASTRLHYTEILDQTSSPIGGALDMLRTRPRTVKAVLSRVGPYLERLVETNGSRVANDLVERVTRSRTALEQELRAALRQVTDVAQRALTHADALRSSGDQAVTAELNRIAQMRREVILSLNEPEGGTP